MTLWGPPVSEVIQLSRPPEKSRHLGRGPAGPALHTDSVSVLFTTEEETLAAARVGSVLAEAMAVPLTVIHFRTVPYPLSVHAPVGVSPVESDVFRHGLESCGIDARVRVFLCRKRESVIPMAFKGHSLIIMGGKRRWWPTAAQRLRRRLEAAGHFVLFVDVDEPIGSQPMEASCA